MRVIYFNARGSRHILGGDFRLFQSGSHLSFLRHMRHALHFPLEPVEKFFSSACRFYILRLRMLFWL